MMSNWKLYAYQLIAFRVLPRNSPPLSNCRMLETSVDAIILIITGAISAEVLLLVASTSHFPE
jgi:hypothetical protein